MIFVLVRDRSGLLQVIFDGNEIEEELFTKAGTLRNEFVVAIVGKVEARSEDINPNMKTGEIEIRAEQLRIYQNHRPRLSQ